MISSFEIDILNAGSNASNDSICIRYTNEMGSFVHLVDGGCKNTGELIIDHINVHCNTNIINNLIVSHNDNDHTSGLERVLKECKVYNLWMNKPWEFAPILQKMYKIYQTDQDITRRLKESYKNSVKLEEIALRQKIKIYQAFQGMEIGPFTVMAPSVKNYIKRVVEADKTHKYPNENSDDLIKNHLFLPLEFQNIWGQDNLSENVKTSNENEMSIVQFGNICNQGILLTGDSGKIGLKEAALFATGKYGDIPKVDIFQVPNFGFKNNLTPIVLDMWFGEKLENQSQYTGNRFSAYISGSINNFGQRNGEIVRALMHRNGKVFVSKSRTLVVHANLPSRSSESPVPLIYPSNY